MSYQLHLNLRQRAALQIAISFWEQKERHDRIMYFFEDYEDEEIEVAREEWYYFTNREITEWIKVLLPQNLEVELIHIIKSVATKIFNWYQYIRSTNQRSKIKDYIDKIYWTPYGTVDAIKIFRLSCLENSSVRVDVRYDIACEYALEDYIDKLWGKMPKNIQEKYNLTMYHIGIPVSYHVNHMKAYWKYCRDMDLSFLIHKFEYAAEISRDNEFDRHEFRLSYNENLTTEENMFRLSVYVDQSVATKYFWNKLTEEEKKKSVVECARMTVERFSDCQEDCFKEQGYAGEEYLEICIFLMNQMTAAHKKLFFNGELGLYQPYKHREDIKDEILKMLLSTWPSQELFIPTLKDMLQYLDENSRMPLEFLDTIKCKMYDDHKLRYPVENSIYGILLREAWLIIPESIKQKTNYTSIL